MAAQKWVVTGPGLLVPAQFILADDAVACADRHAEETGKPHSVFFAVQHYSTETGHENDKDAEVAAAAIAVLRAGATDAQRIAYADTKALVAQKAVDAAFSAWTNRKASSDDASLAANEATDSLLRLRRALTFDASVVRA